MTLFIVLALLLTLLVLGWMARPLLRSTPPLPGVSSRALNSAIYKDQFEALERDLAAGRISQADYEATRDELQVRLLEDADDSASPVPAAPGFFTGRRTAALMVLTVPLLAAGLYAWHGTPAALDPQLAQRERDDQVNKMVEQLAAKLKAKPDNPKGWAMLARSYKVMGRLDDADAAFKNVGALLDTDPDVMVDYADLLAMRADNRIEGKSLALVNKALQIDPKHMMGLMMSGVASYRANDFAQAVKTWEKLEGLLDPQSPDFQEIERSIAEARVKAGLPPKAAPSAMAAASPGAADVGKLPPVDPSAAGGMTPERINQMVERLADKLKANPNDLEGWAKLGRAYKVLGRLDDADKAYAKASKLVDSNPDLLTQYADLLAMKAGNKMDGRPLDLVNKALALNPVHPQALMMAGSAAFRRGDYSKAAGYWEKVLTVLDPSSSDAIQVKAELADARSRAAQGAAPK